MSVGSASQRSPSQLLALGKKQEAGRRALQPTAFLRGPGWGGRGEGAGGTHRAGLSAGGLAPKVGGNDRDEELEDGEDGKHGQIAPAHILGTHPESRQAQRSSAREGRAPEGQ